MTKTINLIELTPDQVIGFNRRAIVDAHRKDLKCAQKHQLRDRNGLEGCLGGIFYCGYQGTYQNLPLEKMAGLLLYRISEKQFFLDGNKRTAVMACYFFLFNNGYDLKIERTKMNDLIWGFAPDVNAPGAPRRYNEDDAVQYVLDNINPRSTT